LEAFLKSFNPKSLNIFSPFAFAEGLFYFLFPCNFSFPFSYHIIRIEILILSVIYPHANARKGLCYQESVKEVNKMNKKFLLLGLAAILMIILLTSCCASIIPDLGLATVEEIDILTLESFPVQVFIIASGYLPNPCTEIYQITQEREGNTFFITIETYCSQEVCIQVIAPFEEVIPLEVYGLPAGTYTVEVNGVQGSFILEIDNILSM
jgi:hypothetical protein